MEAPNIQTLLGKVAGSGREIVNLERGEVLFRQGDPGDSLYVVRSGRVRAIYNQGEKDEKILGEIGRGEPVGEMALLGDGERTATLVAIRDSELARISQSDFEALTKSQPREVIELIRVVAQRLKESRGAGLRESLPSCIAVIPAAPDAPLKDYCERLGQAMREGGHDPAVIAARELPASLAEETDPMKIARWLDERESEVPMMILESDATLTSWTRQCLRQADLVLVLGHFGSDPRPGEIERALEELCEPSARPKVHLVLMHEGAPPYSGTGEWLSKRNVAKHHHLRMDSEEQRARACRLLTGTDITLVLGGGGARGYGHIGVIRALAESGIPVDRVGGTSMGACVGGLLAMGMDWKEILDRCRERFAEVKSLKSPTLPVVSLDSAKRYLGTLDKLFKEVRIEDLPVDYYCVSCNLTKAMQVIHREGRLATWVASSMSLPGVVPPLVVDGEMLVDGGVLNNVPVDIARHEGSGKVIAVDVSPDVELAMAPGYNGRPGALEALRSRFPGKAAIPGILAILNRVCNMSSLSGGREFRDMADLYLKLPMTGFKTFDWGRIDEIVERGYRNASERIAEWMDK